VEVGLAICLVYGWPDSITDPRKGKAFKQSSPFSINSHWVVIVINGNMYNYLITGNIGVQKSEGKVSIIKVLLIIVITIQSYRKYIITKPVNSLNNLKQRTFIDKQNNKKNAYLFSRNIVAWSQLILNFLHKEALCLERAIIYSTVLRKLGIDARVVIGRSSTAIGLNMYQFHAWVEVNDMPVNEKLNIKVNYIILSKTPA